jgi:Fe-S cluster assembly protein SufD
MELVSSFSESTSAQISRALAEPANLAASRAAAWAEFHRTSWPNRKTEAFKYTDLTRVPLESLDLLKPAPAPVPQSVWQRVEQSGLAGYLIFVDGVLAQSQVPPGVNLAPLSQVLAQNPELVAPYLYQAVGPEGKFRAQNAAFWQAGDFAKFLPV